MRTITIGTRGSRLALAQARSVISALRFAHRDRAFRIAVIRTRGDRKPRTPLSELGGTGFFVKEIEDALLAGACDIAVHSLKDLPLAQPPGLTVAAVMERADPFDVLVSRGGEELLDLPGAARVGTSSARRTAQILSVRPDLGIVPMRGNVETRLGKLRSGLCEAVVLAAAGLARLGMAGHRSERLTPPHFLPAPGQGCLALEVRGDDREAFEIARSLNHGHSAACATAERSLLRALGGGCRTTVGAYAEVTEAEEMRLAASVHSPRGERAVRGELAGSPSDGAAIGSRLARELLAKGAAALLGR